jgi:hypothetical protein
MPLCCVTFEPIQVIRIFLEGRANLTVYYDSSGLVAVYTVGLRLICKLASVDRRGLHELLRISLEFLIHAFLGASLAAAVHKHLVFTNP